MTNFWQTKHVLVTGGHGFLGSHLCNRLAQLGAIIDAPHSNEFDLRRRDDIICMFSRYLKNEADFVFNLAANVGGIGYNQLHGYDLYFDNMSICLNLIDEAIRQGVKKFVQVGTVCAYPKFTPVPFDERALWDGYPEETNAPYGLAKRMALVQLQEARKAYGFNGIYLLPTNLYGPGDNFNPAQSHVIPALIRRFVEAVKEQSPFVSIWGTGDASRDFLYVKDAVCGIIVAAEKWDSPEPLNLGSGKEIRIAALVECIRKLTGYEGRIQYDGTRPDGQPRRSLRIWRAKELGWQPETSLEDGLRSTIEWYNENLG